jgi:hypothetical protein
MARESCRTTLCGSDAVLGLAQPPAHPPLHLVDKVLDNSCFVLRQFVASEGSNLLKGVEEVAPLVRQPLVSGQPARIARRARRDRLSHQPPTSRSTSSMIFAGATASTGRAYHLSLDARAAEAMRPGDVVSFTTKPEAAVSPIDREIAEVARAHGGVYTLERTPGATSPPHERRLRELERLGLATPAEPDRWRVSPDLLQALAERHREAPVRHRLLIRKEAHSVPAQVEHPGPVWLDRVATDSLAPYGFGAELRRAVEQRCEALRRLGLQPEDPDQSARAADR